MNYSFTFKTACPFCNTKFNVEIPNSSVSLWDNIRCPHCQKTVYPFISSSLQNQFPFVIRQLKKESVINKLKKVMDENERLKWENEELEMDVENLMFLEKENKELKLGLYNQENKELELLRKENEELERKFIYRLGEAVRYSLAIGLFIAVILIPIYAISHIIK